MLWQILAARGDGQSSWSPNRQQTRPPEMQAVRDPQGAAGESPSSPSASFLCRPSLSTSEDTLFPAYSHLWSFLQLDFGNSFLPCPCGYPHVHGADKAG